MWCNVQDSLPVSQFEEVGPEGGGDTEGQSGEGGVKGGEEKVERRRGKSGGEEGRKWKGGGEKVDGWKGENGSEGGRKWREGGETVERRRGESEGEEGRKCHSDDVATCR